MEDKIIFNEFLEFQRVSDTNVYKATKCEHVRTGYDSCGNVVWFDPPGGKLVNLGSRIGDKTISDMYWEDGEFKIILN